ncbi:MAG: DMP19 family protein [Clostridia bacterium]|nr:DMP19 family protein [Clostridia bacterium]
MLQNVFSKGKLKKIWNMEDVNERIMALSEYVAEKCQFGIKMEKLSHPERVFFITQNVEIEVNNGGFSQFFYNSSGDFAGEMVEAFQEIGAEKTAVICQHALDAIGQPLPQNRAERIELIEAIETDALMEALNACDDAFYEYRDDLNALNDAYVQKNKADFT